VSEEEREKLSETHLCALEKAPWVCCSRILNQLFRREHLYNLRFCFLRCDN